MISVALEEISIKDWNFLLVSLRIMHVAFNIINKSLNLKCSSNTKTVEAEAKKTVKHQKIPFINPWSPGGSFMVQKMAVTSPIPVF